MPTQIELDLDAWCLRVAGLSKKDEGWWIHQAITPVSYPEDGLEILVAIENSSFWFGHRNQVIASFVRQFAPNGTIFDVGGGNGFVSVGLEAAGFECVVIEPSASGAKACRARSLRVIQAAFQDLNLPASSIPCAAMFDVLEHIDDHVGALRGLFRVMRPGGRLYLAVPAFNVLWSQEDVAAGHFRRYTHETLGQVIKKAGFTLEFQNYFFAPLVPVVFLLRSLLSRLPCHKLAVSAKRTAQDHTLPQGLIGDIIRSLLSWELRRVATGRGIALGTSCFAVAQKPA